MMKEKGGGEEKNRRQATHRSICGAMSWGEADMLVHLNLLKIVQCQQFRHLR